MTGVGREDSVKQKEVEAAKRAKAIDEAVDSLSKLSGNRKVSEKILRDSMRKLSQKYVDFTHEHRVFYSSPAQNLMETKVKDAMQTALYVVQKKNPKITTEKDAVGHEIEEVRVETRSSTSSTQGTTQGQAPTQKPPDSTGVGGTTGESASTDEFIVVDLAGDAAGDKRPLPTPQTTDEMLSQMQGQSVDKGTTDALIVAAKAANTDMRIAAANVADAQGDLDIVRGQKRMAEKKNLDPNSESLTTANKNVQLAQEALEKKRYEY